MSEQSNKSNNIDTITSLSRATSYNSSDNKKPIIKFIYDDTNKQGLPKISKTPGAMRRKKERKILVKRKTKKTKKTKTTK